VYPWLAPWLAIHSSQFLPSCTGGHAAVGDSDGDSVGACDGDCVGTVIGDSVGSFDGECVGAIVQAHPAQLYPAPVKNAHVYSGFCANHSSQFLPPSITGHAAVGATVVGADVGALVHGSHVAVTAASTV